MRYHQQKIVSPLKIFGGKSGLAKRLASVMHRRDIFVEGFCATAITSLVLDESFELHFCFDLNRWIINFWHVLQAEPHRLQKFLLNTEYSEENFQRAYKHVQDHEDESGDNFFDAAMYFCVNRMSRGADGKTFGWSDRLRRGMPEYISAYRSAVDNLIDIASLVKNINFRHGDYVDLMLEYQLNECDNVCQYLDPPYPRETRISKNSYGKYELATMCAETELGQSSHECLIDFVKHSCAGVTYLSTYPNELYQGKLRGYNYQDFHVVNSASQSKIKPRKTERLYIVDNLKGPA